MRRLVVSVLLIVALTGCALGSSDKAVACSGKRRPANPFGSVLQPTPAPAEPPKIQQSSALGGAPGPCGSAAT